MPNNLGLQIIYPDYTFAKLDSRTFSYYEIKKQEIKCQGKKVRKIRKFVCFVCQQKSAKIKHAHEFSKHVQSKKHLENLEEFNRMVDLFANNL